LAEMGKDGLGQHDDTENIGVELGKKLVVTGEKDVRIGLTHKMGKLYAT